MRYLTTLLVIAAFSLTLGCGGSRGGSVLENATQQQIDDFEAAEKAAQEQMQADMEAGLASERR